jgi:hypothetical protein
MTFWHKYDIFKNNQRKESQITNAERPAQFINKERRHS